MTSIADPEVTVQLLTEQAEQAIASGNIADAVAKCEQALAINAHHAPACKIMGVALHLAGQVDEAITWYIRALQYQPSLVEVYFNLGSLYTQQQQLTQAISYYETALKLKPDFAEAYGSLAQIFSKLQRQPEANRYWYQALTRQPNPAPIADYLRLGSALGEQGDLDLAVDCYHRVLQQVPDHEAAHAGLGETLVRQGLWESAIICYQQQLRLRPDSALAYFHLGDIYLQLEQFDAAITALQRSLELNPDLIWAYHHLGQVYLKRQQWETAITFCRSVLEKYPQAPWAYTHLGRALAAQGESAAAIACNQQASQLRGWPTCSSHNYQFSQDWFTHNIVVWEAHLSAFANLANLNFLEIGSFEGMSACWFLDRILTHPSSTITCIDLEFKEFFDLNIARTDQAHKVRKLSGKSQEWLPTLEKNFFHLAYIDGCHLAQSVYQDALISWGLLKLGGMMIFDDYEWVEDRNNPERNPKLGVDRFLGQFVGQYQILHKAYQLILKKNRLILSTSVA
ncbi:hypothetical protein DO97_08175 [Neosynechococcus sphagnicola sy1]|uniref:Uncharacterized protein n=1 Tax=Neosynechococcus sphagnicola sy1 TaxID=1497020 RepID=A0A098TNV4_9CYAN|nr:tetratricopeptide repeat protein [Neosynechococcus sphagnicola]KGF72513.1 hypothetical protein DO97_08175 [Neosynechococcus sphagnicola sy1]